MNEVYEKKTGVVRLGNGMIIPCDATINTDATFDKELIGTIGERMYFLNPEYEFDLNTGSLSKFIVDASAIKEVVIYKIAYATGCATCLYGKVIETEEEVGAIQELFFRSHEEAIQAIESITQFYKENELGKDWLEDYKKCVHHNYLYVLQFPVKPQDIILEDNDHYLANRVIAYIWSDKANIMYLGHDDKSYVSGKELHTEHEYAGIKQQYEIVRKLSEKEVIIDV